MILNVNRKEWLVNEVSIAINTLAVVLMIASIWDGVGLLVAGILVGIFDVIRYPYDNILEMKEPEDDGGEDDDLAI